MKQLERLQLHQGNRCFFCDQPIPDGEASVEHIVALANGGTKDDDNCVVCCKSVNAALGHLTVKDKLRTVLAQRAAFACPDSRLTRALEVTSADASSWTLTLAEVTENLRKRADKRPVKLASLKNAIKTSFPKAGALQIERALKQ